MTDPAHDDEDDDLDWSAFDIDGPDPAPAPTLSAAAKPHGPLKEVAAPLSARCTVPLPRPIPGARRRKRADDSARAARRKAGAAFHARARLTDDGDASTAPKCINLDRDEGEEAVCLPVTINPYLKAHQLEGIRFLWNHTVRQPDPRLRGCVLAHSMGLGKTLQTVMFTYLFLRHKVGSRVLVVTPKSTLFSWADEFEGWCTRCQLGRVRVRNLDDNIRKAEDRRELVSEWMRCGGVLLVGYELFTLLSGVARPKGRTKVHEGDPGPFREAFQDPGPDLVICDEGHRLKNQKLLSVVALKALTTTRRVVLTGTPLQNHLMEYYCMVDFVREGYWSRKEFRELFDAPIKAGQHDESSAEEVKVMKRRAYALSNELKTFVLRRDQTVLMKELPPKHEFVLVIRLSPLQQALCRQFVSAYAFQRRDTLYFTSVLNKICAHPDILRDYLARATKYGSGARSKVNSLLDDAGIDLNDWMPSDDEEQGGKGRRPQELTEERDFTWAAGLFPSDYQEGVVEYSSKMWVLKSIVEKCLARGEKLLIFSMWTSVLDMLERFLKGLRHPLTTAQWQARAGKRPPPTAAPATAIPGVGELTDVLMTLQWRQRDIEKILQLWSDPRMTMLRECNSEQDNELLDSLRRDLTQQVQTVAGQVAQVQARRDQLLGQEAISDDETCDAALRPFVKYCRIDGCTSSMDRQEQIQEFNDPSSDKHVFLISTKAGGVGISLTGASRVVMFDMSWNPSDDAQAIFRTYRYGQTRPVMIYRLVAEGTPEEKIYDLKVGKEWLFKKVVDELAPSRAFVKQSSGLDHLFEYKEEEDFQHPQEAVSRMNRKVRCMNNDPLLTYVYANNVQAIRRMFPHESLLVDDFGEQIETSEMAASMDEYAVLRHRIAMKALADPPQGGKHPASPLTSTATSPAPSASSPSPETFTPQHVYPGLSFQPPSDQPPQTALSLSAQSPHLLECGAGVGLPAAFPPPQYATALQMQQRQAMALHRQLSAQALNPFPMAMSSPWQGLPFQAGSYPQAPALHPAGLPGANASMGFLGIPNFAPNPFMATLPFPFYPTPGNP